MLLDARAAGTWLDTDRCAICGAVPDAVEGRAKVELRAGVGDELVGGNVEERSLVIEDADLDGPSLDATNADLS